MLFAHKKAAPQEARLSVLCEPQWKKKPNPEQRGGGGGRNRSWNPGWSAKVGFLLLGLVRVS